MENASKAIIIAGGVLISIIAISIFYFIFANIGIMAEGTETEYEQQELVAFNTGFEAYNKKLMYGIDIISVLNQAIDNNTKYGVEYYHSPKDKNDLEFYVNVVFTYEGKEYSLINDYTKPGIKGKRNLIQEMFLDRVDLKENDENNIFSFKTSGFKCEKVLYNEIENTKNKAAVGRIKEMRFVKFNK